MNREEADLVVASYDAQRYAEEMPDRLLEALAKAPVLPWADDDVPQTERRKLSIEEIKDLTSWASEGVLPKVRLTQGQRDVLLAASHGMTYKEMAEKRFVSEQTVRTQLRLARRKLGARNTAHAVAIAIKEGYF